MQTKGQIFFIIFNWASAVSTTYVTLMKLENKNRNNISAGECNTIEISYLKDIIQLKLKLTIHQIRLLSFFFG